MPRTSACATSATTGFGGALCSACCRRLHTSGPAWAASGSWVTVGIRPRSRCGPRIGIVGHGWDSPAPWAGDGIVEDAWFTDPEYLHKLDVEVLPPVRFDQ